MNDLRKENGEFIFEYVVMGNFVKATIFHTATMREVSVVGARGTPKEMLEKLAMRKLQYIMNKKS